MGYAVFVSDNRGRVHVWTPIYKEREKDEKPTRKSRPTKCVYSGNTDHEPFRPMQNVAADPMGAWLAGTDWSGFNYLWRVKQIVVGEFIAETCEQKWTILFNLCLYFYRNA